MKVLVVSFSPPSGAIIDNFTQIANHLPNYSRKNLLAILSLASLKSLFRLAQDEFDVIFFFDQNAINIFFSLFCKARSNVMWWHEPLSRGRLRFVNYIVYSCNDFYMTKKSKKIILACQSLRNRVPLRLKYKLEVIPLPFLDYFSENVQSQMLPKKIDLVFFGKIERYKGLDILAEALQILYDKGLNISLAILGVGNLSEKAPLMSKLIESYPNRINLLNDYQPYDTIAQYIRASKAVVLPYLSATGSNTVSISYRYSRPVIATETGSFQDYIIEGETGFLAKPSDPISLADAVERALSDQKKLEFLGEKAYEFYEQYFTQSSVSEKLLDVFERCLN
jgi:glycosyltransferase involved in cell wall biosynthesis